MHLGVIPKREPKPSNSQASRTVGAICLGPTGNQQGGYKFYNLRTGKRITRRKWKALPMPHDVIAHVNNIGQSQGQPSLLTFQYPHGNSIGEDDPDSLLLTRLQECPIQRSIPHQTLLISILYPLQLQLTKMQIISQSLKQKIM